MTANKVIVKGNKNQVCVLIFQCSEHTGLQRGLKQLLKALECPSSTSGSRPRSLQAQPGAVPSVQGWILCAAVSTSSPGRWGWSALDLLLTREVTPATRGRWHLPPGRADTCHQRSRSSAQVRTAHFAVRPKGTYFHRHPSNLCIIACKWELEEACIWRTLSSEKRLHLYWIQGSEIQCKYDYLIF